MLWWSKDNPTLITLNDQNHPRHYHSSLFAVYTQYIYLGITMHHSVSQMFAESHPPLLLLLDCWHTQFTIMTKFSDLRNNASLISDSSRKNNHWESLSTVASKLIRLIYTISQISNSTFLSMLLKKSLLGWGLRYLANVIQPWVTLAEAARIKTFLKFKMEHDRASNFIFNCDVGQFLYSTS